MCVPHSPMLKLIYGNIGQTDKDVVFFHQYQVYGKGFNPTCYLLFVRVLDDATEYMHQSEILLHQGRLKQLRVHTCPQCNEDNFVTLTFFF